MSIPIDIRTDATTMSMIRNGINRTKPIWKAVLSSLVMKAGMIMYKGRSSGFLGKIGF